MLSLPSKGILPEGIVSDVLVQPGSRVQKGDLLVRIDTRDLELRIAQARAVLAQAKSNHDKLLGGATTAEIELAQAQLAGAQAHTQQVRGSVTTQDIAAAQAKLNQARANLSVVLRGTKATRVQAAQATLNQARAKLQTQQDKLSADKTNAQLHMEQAANELRNQQDAYSRIVWENQSRGGALEQADKDREAAALRAVQDADKALQEATVNYEQAKQVEISELAAAQSEVDGAQAFLGEQQAGADADILASARAQVAQAEADLAKLQGDQRAGMLASAMADEAAAQAALSKLTADPATVEVAIAVAQVQQAEVALKREELTLELASLRAPIAGTVVEVNVKAGEVPNIGEPTIILADLSAWQIETEDLTESGVVQLHEGDLAEITFDAIPDFTLTGKVSRIEALGHSTELNRKIFYTVMITPDNYDPRLRWNMSASIEFKPKV
jgi:HlyD family secretion protein